MIGPTFIRTYQLPSVVKLCDDCGMPFRDDFVVELSGYNGRLFLHSACADGILPESEMDKARRERRC